jgi:uncharacterized membrane protein YccC
MIFQQSLNKFSVLRRALGAALAVVVAVICERYYASEHQFLIPIVTVIIIQLKLYANVKQVLQLFLLVAIIIFAAVMFAQLLPSHPDFHSYMHDVIIGGLIGVVARILFFVDALAEDFRQRIVPVLQAYDGYLSAIGNLFLRQPDALALCEQQKYVVENALLAELPDWVYQRGFNPVLQQGHRHFLIRVEKVGATLFAMNYAARQSIDVDLLQDFREPILQAIAGAKEILAVMIKRLLAEKYDKPVTDLAEEITALEKTFRSIIDIPFELLDSSKNAMVLSAFIYDLKDLRLNLVKIAEALR